VAAPLLALDAQQLGGGCLRSWGTAGGGWASGSVQGRPGAAVAVQTRCQAGCCHPAGAQPHSLLAGISFSCLEMAQTPLRLGLGLVALQLDTVGGDGPISAPGICAWGRAAPLFADGVRC